MKKLFNKMFRKFRKKKTAESGIEFLNQVRFLKNLNKSEKNKFAHLLIERKYKKDEVVFEENYPHAVLYIIKEGAAKVVIQRKENQVELATLKAGDYLGEIGLFVDSTRTANVVTTEDSVLLAISKSAFKDFIDRHPKIGSKILYRFAKKLSKDLIKTNRLLAKNESEKN